MKSTAVVILNYNGRKFLEQFLPSVVKYSSEAEVIVADNASTDDSVDFLKKSYPDIKIVINEKNGGFAKGYNDALAKVKADYFVLLNSDIEVTENWLSEPIKVLSENDDIVACQPKIKAFHDKEEFEHAGAAGGFIDKWGYPFCRGRLFNKAEKDHGQYDSPKDIFWATGACLFIKSEIYLEMGGFDNDFFAHMEEIDLCWRIKNSGKKIVYVPESTIYHVGGGTLQRTSPLKTFLNFRNGLVLLYKNLPTQKLFFTILWRLILDGVAGTAFLFAGKPKHTWAVIRAHFSFYGGFRKWKVSRKHSQQFVKTYRHKEIYQGSIVWTFFAKGIKNFSAIKGFGDKKGN